MILLEQRLAGVKRYISPISPEVLHEWIRIVTKFGVWSRCAEIINCVNFGNRFKGFDSVGGGVEI